MPAPLALFAVGAVFGTLLDLLHVATGTTRYVAPTSFGVPWWVPFEFGCAALGIGLSHTTIDLLLGRTVTLGRSQVAWGLAAFLALWAASGLVKPTSAGLWVLVPGALATWWIFERTVVGIVLAFATASCGVAIEASLVSTGTFAYLAPDAGRVASWLPWLYVAASVAVGNLARWLATPGAPAPRPGSAAS